MLSPQVEELLRIRIGSVHVYIEAGGAMLCLLGILLTLVMRETIAKRSRRYFRLYFLLLIIDLIASATVDLLPAAAELRVWRYRAYLLHMVIGPSLAYLVSFFLLDVVDPDRVRGRLRRNLFMLLFFHVYLVLIMQSRSLYMSFDQNGVFHKGPYYFVFALQCILPLMLDFVILLHENENLARWEKIAFWIYCGLPAVAFVASVLVDDHIIIYATLVAALTMFLLILVNQIEHYRRKEFEAMEMRAEAAEKENESTEMRMALMLSQIQPHFLYNSLSVIQNLCYGVAPEAEAATARFARYLRHNMSSMTNQSLIPFSEELAHAKNYLELERLRFGDQLQIRFDTQCTDFRLPPLTLQPIAENAVRHGVRMKPDGRGTVAVATREFPDRFEIFVLDNGPGFDPSQPPPAPTPDGSLHIGIRNVRERLDRMCGGTLEFDSAPGRGTTAVIILPKKRQGG